MHQMRQPHHAFGSGDTLLQYALLRSSRLISFLLAIMLDRERVAFPNASSRCGQVAKRCEVQGVVVGVVQFAMCGANNVEVETETSEATSLRLGSLQYWLRTMPPGDRLSRVKPPNLPGVRSAALPGWCLTCFLHTPSAAVMYCTCANETKDACDVKKRTNSNKPAAHT